MSDTLKDQFAKLLTGMAKYNASDLHIKVGHPPYYRIQSALRAAKVPPIPDSRAVEEMLQGVIPEERRGEFEQHGAMDFAMYDAGGDRYRVNMFRSMGETHVSIRRVLREIPTFEELHLPEVYHRTISRCFSGLILISGVTGAGKSTTLAAMVERINQLRSMHIVTIEDPIEFVFKPKKSIISQREIGIDVPNHHDALRSVVRQDPNCIMIGEMRDRETMTAAIQAAETGHLVIGSLHVADVQQTFNRILEFFPRTEHAFVRSSMAGSLKAIMSQKLLAGIDEGTRFPATEVLLTNPVVKEKILREKDNELPGVILQYHEEGMRSFTQSLCELIETEKVHYDTAMEQAPNRDALASAVKGITTG